MHFKYNIILESSAEKFIFDHLTEFINTEEYPIHVTRQSNTLNKNLLPSPLIYLYYFSLFLNTDC